MNKPKKDDFMTNHQTPNSSALTNNMNSNDNTIEFNKNPNIDGVKAVTEIHLKTPYKNPYDILQYVDTSSDLKPWITFFKKFMNKSETWLRKALVKHQAKCTLEMVLDEVPTDAVDFVKLYFKKHKINITLNGRFKQTYLNYTYNDPSSPEAMIINMEDFKELKDHDKDLIKVYNPDFIDNDIIVARLREFVAKYDLKFSETRIKDALVQWIDSEKRALREKLIQSISNKPEGVLRQQIMLYENLTVDDFLTTDQYWDKIVRLITDEDHDLVKAVLKHFIWQVKRKLLNKPVVYHMMPVMYGEQESGKSTFLRAFTKPVKDVYTPSTFNAISDSSNKSLFSDNYVIFLDEMTNADRTNLEVIKGLITDETKQTRQHFTHMNMFYPQNATFIGASNKLLEEMIQDPTGMRRFFEIKFKKINPIDYPKIDQINHLILWQSVNEYSESPIMPVKDLISVKQKEITHKTPFLHWLLSIEPKDLDTEKSYSEWQASFSAFLELNYKNHNYNMTAINREFKKIHPGFYIENRLSGNRAFYTISKVQTIQKENVFNKLTDEELQG